MVLNDFQRKVINILAKHSPVWLVGGAVRDRLLGTDSNDLDLVTFLNPERADNILRASGLISRQIGMRFKTLSLFEADSRIDLVCVDDLEGDARRRDFTINAIYMNPLSEEIYDPLAGTMDLNNKRLRACGDAGERFREDPVRILRMVKFSVRFGLEIEKDTWKEARNNLGLLADAAKERVTSELAGILILADAEKAVRMLMEMGYWDVFIPELARLEGIVQNQYHSLDVWEHTLAVFRNTPEDLFLRLAGLFHDIGKWETASRECFLAGKLEFHDQEFWVQEYKIIGTRGKGELESKIKLLVGKNVKILGSRLDHYPQIVQFKRNLPGEKGTKGLTLVENGKRHFLNHEKAGSKLLVEILKRYCFSMVFTGSGQRREKDLLELIENHMQATLAFMPEFNARTSRRSFKERAAELVWKICWDGRNFKLQKIHDFVLLWKADFQAGKVHNEAQNNIFEKIFNELIRIALWQNENLPCIDWNQINSFVSAQGIKGEKIGKFKNYMRQKAMKEMNLEINTVFLKKAYAEIDISKK